MEHEERFFEVKIDASSLKVFSAALHFCQKVGKDVIIEVEENAFTFRALNENKSAFASVELKSDFFDEHMLFLEEAFACKLPVKPICMIMRNLRAAQHVTLSASRTLAQHELIFRFRQLNGILRTHRFTYADCEVMNPVFREEDCSLVQMRPRLLAHVLQNMHRSPEISLFAAPHTLSVKSYFTPEVLLKDYRFVMNTGMSVNPQELEVFDFRSEANSEELVFCVKEVTAFLAFCEAIELSSFQFFFSSGGRAIKLNSGEELVRVSLVMATIEQAVRSFPAEGQKEEEVPPPSTHTERRARDVVQRRRRPAAEEEEEERESEREGDRERQQYANGVSSSAIASASSSQQMLEASRVLRSIRHAHVDEEDVGATEKRRSRKGNGIGRNTNAKSNSKKNKLMSSDEEEDEDDEHEHEHEHERGSDSGTDRDKDYDQSGDHDDDDDATVDERTLSTGAPELEDDAIEEEAVPVIQSTPAIVHVPVIDVATSSSTSTSDHITQASTAKKTVNRRKRFLFDDSDDD